MIDQATEIITRYFGSAGGELHVNGVGISAIVAGYGTPFFIYDAAVLDRKWNLLRETFPPEFAISYSVKANPNPALVRHFLAKGCGLEIASGGEFHLAVEAGCSPDKILFAGPGKTVAELELVLANGIGEIHVESLLELERLTTISRRTGRRTKVCVRINPGSDARGGAMRMAGKPTPFGIDEENLDTVLQRLCSNPFIEFAGIHLFSGTQIVDPSVLLRQYRKGLEIAKTVACRIRRPLDTIDFGGGFGIPYFANELELDMAKLRAELTGLMAEVKNEQAFNGTSFMIEPGRYLVAEAGIYVTRINDIKVSRGRKFIIVDGGMNHHLAASGNLGQVIKRNFPVTILNKLEEKERETVDVVGPLCTPLDLLARSADLPPANVGDLVGLFQSGAYARTASPLGFLSHRTPAEVFVEQGNVRLIRRSGTYEDLLRDIP